MKNVLVGSFIAASIFAAPMYPVYAQTASTTEEVMASIRIELIDLLMQLVAQLQAQLDAKSARDVEQDEEIAVIKRSSGARATSVQEAEAIDTVNTLAQVRARIGQIEATMSLGEENVYFSVTDYLNTDTVNFDANINASSTEGGCNDIHGTEYKVCGQSAEYPIVDTDVVVNVTVNGVEKTLTLPVGYHGIIRATWPN